MDLRETSGFQKFDGLVRKEERKRVTLFEARLIGEPPTRLRLARALSVRALESFCANPSMGSEICAKSPDSKSLMDSEGQEEAG